MAVEDKEAAARALAQTSSAHHVHDVWIVCGAARACPVCNTLRRSVFRLAICLQQEKGISKAQQGLGRSCTNGASGYKSSARHGRASQPLPPCSVAIREHPTICLPQKDTCDDGLRLVISPRSFGYQNRLSLVVGIQNGCSMRVLLREAAAYAPSSVTSVAHDGIVPIC